MSASLTQPYRGRALPGAPTMRPKTLKAQEVIAAWRSLHPQSDEPQPDWAASLAQFYGTENYFICTLNRRMNCSDGAKFVADHAGAYWLLEEIAIPQMFDPKLRREDFQVWTLTVDRANTCALLVCDNGNGRILLSKEIEYTDFPLDSITFYVEGNVVLLRSEH